MSVSLDSRIVSKCFRSGTVVVDESVEVVLPRVDSELDSPRNDFLTERVVTGSTGDLGLTLGVLHIYIQRRTYKNRNVE